MCIYCIIILYIYIYILIFLFIHIILMIMIIIIINNNNNHNNIYICIYSKNSYFIACWFSISHDIPMKFPEYESNGLLCSLIYPSVLP